MQTLTLKEAQSASWDVIIIGAGMGGGMLGRRLAEQGISVLFIEQGLPGHPFDQAGCEPREGPEDAKRLRGVWHKPTEARLGGVPTEFQGPYGAGVGGSSVFYAAALERPERHDLDDDPNLPHPVGGWPVGFDAFRPYFDAASDLLHLRGTPDPLSDKPVKLAEPMPIGAADAALMQQLQEAGLHPYRLHLAVRYTDNCRQCFGTKCPWSCKMDGRSAGVAPALATGRAGLLTNTRVERLIAQDGSLTGVAVQSGANKAVLTARRYALCAGALASARLMLASGSANSSGWVGRGLMFHLNEMFSLWPKRGTNVIGGFGKAISLRDLYSRDGHRLGLVQSMGLEASYGNVLVFLQRLYDQSVLRRFERPRGLLRIPAMIASRLLGTAGTFVGIMEDLPYAENRVVLNEADPDILTFEYKFHPEILARRKVFRKAIRKAFRGHRLFLSSVQPTLNYGHPVGTLRFGTDPATSVLRPDCRTHDLDNLYVADSSFMPSALGVNPSLTIAANALRVGDNIAKDLAQEQEMKDAATA